MNREALIESIAAIIAHASGEARCCGCYANNAAKLVAEYLATGATSPWKYVEPEEERLERETREAEERKAYAEAQARIEANRATRAAALWADIDPDAALRAQLAGYGWTLMGISFPCEVIHGDATFAANGEIKSFIWSKGQNPLRIALKVASQ